MGDRHDEDIMERKQVYIYEQIVRQYMYRSGARFFFLRITQ